MSSPAALPASPQDAVTLHQRLLAHEPTASIDLAEAYLAPLVLWLAETNPSVPEDMRTVAAEDAILSLIRKPEAYAPARQTLEVYLRLSARGDLRNLLQKERRHHLGRVPWESVEQSADDGKYLGCHDDPALPLMLAEEEQTNISPIPEALRQKLSDTDRRALELILRKVRGYAVFAELYGLLHLPAKEQERTVKRHKDRLKTMFKRAGGKP